MQRKKSERKVKSQLIIGSLFALCGICIFCSKYIYNYFLNKQDNGRIAEFFQEQANKKEIISDKEKIEDNQRIETNQKSEGKAKKRENYIAVIEIPRINLKKGLFSKESLNNTINKNIEILKESDYPDVKAGNFILAGHSGTARISYFNNLYQLEKDDIAFVYYKGKKYKYRLANIYEIEKNGKLDVIRNGKQTIMTLITCKNNSNKQIVFIFELENGDE